MGGSIGELISAVVPLLSVPGVILLMYFIPHFKLEPLARWGIDTEAWRYVPCFFGAYIGYFLPKGNVSIKKKLLTVGIFAAISTLFPFLYNYLSSQPPTESNVEYYSAACFVVFLSLYFSLGFFFTNFGKVMLKKQD